LVASICSLSPPCVHAPVIDGEAVACDDKAMPSFAHIGYRRLALKTAASLAVSLSDVFVARANEV
jgi:hypothetical protein